MTNNRRSRNTEMHASRNRVLKSTCDKKDTMMNETRADVPARALQRAPGSA